MMAIIIYHMHSSYMNYKITTRYVRNACLASNKAIQYMGKNKFSTVLVQRNIKNHTVRKRYLIEILI